MTVAKRRPHAMQCCKTCVFRKPDERDGYKDHGYCQRFPPTLQSFVNANDEVCYEQHWPWMKPDDWCGEFSINGAYL